MVSARDDTKLVERVVDVGDQDVKVLGWPDDAAWADFVATQVEDGVPALEQLIGPRLAGDRHAGCRRDGQPVPLRLRRLVRAR